MLFNEVNTATTLSIRYRPGQDTRIPTTKSDSLFTFGYFRLESNPVDDSINNVPQELSFDAFSTLSSLKAEGMNTSPGKSVLPNELNLLKTDPNSYVYFASLYSEMVTSVNNVVSTFPYAILSSTVTGNTITNYNEFTLSGLQMCSFSIPVSSVTNQGDIIYNSGFTFYNPNQYSLINDTNEFVVQLSGQTISTNEIHEIYSYVYSSNTELSFVVYGKLFSGSPVATNNLPVYVRPTIKRYNNFFNNLSSLEKQLLIGQQFYVPNTDDNGETLTDIVWPKSLDGFAPDSIGSSFETYQDDLYDIARRIDDVKTNWMLRTFVGDNFVDFDSDNEDFSKIVQGFGHEFDQIKLYIDNLAYAYSVTYSGEESVPNKFLYKLSNLLGWRLSDAFNEVDLFEYLAGDVDGQNNSYSYYNLEIWKRILVNINWLYKKKGTRDALSFIFKLIGAPDCLVEFNEFVYKVKQASPIIINPLSATTAQIVSASKINDNGYPNFLNLRPEEEDLTLFAFQEGGLGRGDGQAYINQWRPEFDPELTVDNIKSVTGNPTYYGSQNVLNTKELCLSLDPAKAVECDVHKFYMSADTCWIWGSTGTTLAFSALTVPFEYLPSNCDTVNPSFISGMTVAQYVDYIFMSNVDPTTRKTNHQSHTTFHYPELKKIYMNYYLSSYPTDNCKLTIRKIEPFLEKIELQIQDYLFQLLPATTILKCQGTTYRNPVFHRQRFVYRNGINRGSEFKKELPVDLTPSIKPVSIGVSVSTPISPTINPISISNTIVGTISQSINVINITSSIVNSIDMNIDAVGSDVSVSIGTPTLVSVSIPPTPVRFP